MKLTRQQKLTVFLKCAELIFDKEKYFISDGFTGNEAHDHNVARNMAFASYAAEMAEEMIWRFQEIKDPK